MNVVRPNLTNLKRHNKTKQSKAKKTTKREKCVFEIHCVQLYYSPKS